MKKDNELYSKDEIEFFKKIEAGELPPLPEKEFQKEKKRFQKIVADTARKKLVSIRLYEKDIEKIKAIALHEGLPYQTLVSSILHKYVKEFKY